MRDQLVAESESGASDDKPVSQVRAVTGNRTQIRDYDGGGMKFDADVAPCNDDHFGRGETE